MISGVVELVLAADPALEKTDRRFLSGFGVTSLVVGVGRVRGATRVQAVGTTVGATLGVIAPLTALRTRLRSSADLEAARNESESVSWPDRREQIRGFNDVAGGLISLAIAADPSMVRPQRLATATIGASAIAGGLGRLTGQRAGIVIGGLGYLFALAGAVLTAIRRIRARRAKTRNRLSQKLLRRR